MTTEERSERRKDRLARNEALFREVNERVREVGERAGLDMIDFICECGDADCTAVLNYYQGTSVVNLYTLAFHVYA